MFIARFKEVSGFELGMWRVGSFLGGIGKVDSEVSYFGVGIGSIFDFWMQSVVMLLKLVLVVGVVSVSLYAGLGY